MTMTSTLLSYPEPASSRSGCKVSWNCYADEALAKECSKAARHNMRILEAQGYDFGYQSPGQIKELITSTGLLWEVTLP